LIKAALVYIKVIKYDVIGLLKANNIFDLIYFDFKIPRPL